MAQRIQQQRAGRGTPTFKGTIHAKARTSYGSKATEKLTRGQIVSFYTDPVHSGVLAKVLMEDGTTRDVLAAEGVRAHQEVQFGSEAALQVGNVLPLADITEGCPVFGIERIPGDGGTMVKSSGLYGLVTSKDARGVYVKLPSGRTISFSPKSRATVGCSAGGGRTDKPMVKAGAKYYQMRAKHKKYPSVRGVAMNAIDHPFGGAQHHAGKSKSTSRHAAPGRKVGAIASRRTGRKKK